MSTVCRSLEEGVSQLVCRLRFLPGNPEELLMSDSAAFEYFYHQTTADVLLGRFDDELTVDAAFQLSAVYVQEMMARVGSHEKKFSVKNFEYVVELGVLIVVICYCLPSATAFTVIRNGIYCVFEWRLFIIISRANKWGTLKSAGNPRRAVHAEIHSICTDRPRLRPQVCKCPPPQIPVSQSPF